MCPYACPLARVFDAPPQTVGVFEDDALLLALSDIAKSATPEGAHAALDGDDLVAEIPPSLWSTAWDL